ncbi:MAG: hypothetical protein PF447_00105, partial [Spirochaetaceae bacterium]|nr:hypothetical protein [Spirochaetaceae bacterium]
MKIRGKLISVTTITVLGALFALGIFFINQIPIKNIRDEKSYLIDLQHQLALEHQILLDMLFFDLEGQQEKWSENHGRSLELIETVKGFKQIPSLSSDLERAVKNITALFAFSGSGFNQLENRNRVVLQQAKDLGIESVVLTDLLVNDIDKDESTVDFYESLNLLVQTIRRASDNYSIIEEVLLEQFQIIDNSIIVKERSMTVLSLIVAVSLILISYGLSIIFGRRIAKRIQLLEAGVERIAKGDLTLR